MSDIHEILKKLCSEYESKTDNAGHLVCRIRTHSKVFCTLINKFTCEKINGNEIAQSLEVTKAQEDDGISARIKVPSRT